MQVVEMSLDLEMWMCVNAPHKDSLVECVSVGAKPSCALCAINGGPFAMCYAVIRQGRKAVDLRSIGLHTNMRVRMPSSDCPVLRYCRCAHVGPGSGSGYTPQQWQEKAALAPGQ